MAKENGVKGNSVMKQKRLKTAPEKQQMKQIMIAYAKVLGALRALPSDSQSRVLRAVVVLLEK